MQILGLAHLSMLDVGPLELVDAAVAGGFNAVGLRILPPRHSPVHWQVVGNAALLRQIRRQAQAAGVRIFDVESFTLHAETEVQHLHSALDAAAELGATQVLTASTDPDPERFAERFSGLCDEAAARGLRVGLEFMPFREVRSLSDAIDVVRASGRANAGVIVDALHWSRSGGTLAELAAMEPRWLAHLQFCDAAAEVPAPDALAAEARGGRLYPGEGGLPLDALLRAVPPGTPVMVEAPSARHAGLSPNQRAVLLGDSTRGFIARAAHAQQQSAS